MTTKIEPWIAGYDANGKSVMVSNPITAEELRAEGIIVYDKDPKIKSALIQKDESKRSRRKPYQPVRFADHTPLEGYYNDGHGNLYSVARLIDMCKDLEPFDAPLQAFDLSAPVWQDYSIFDLAFHVKAVNEADLDYPIILDWNGSIADGRHRLIKALVLGHSTIKCVRMYWKPEADKQI